MLEIAIPRARMRRLARPGRSRIGDQPFGLSTDASASRRRTAADAASIGGGTPSHPNRASRRPERALSQPRASRACSTS
jgi:hypothetical protein